MTKEESRSRLNLILNEGEDPYLLYADSADKYSELKLKGKE